MPLSAAEVRRRGDRIRRRRNALVAGGAALAVAAVAVPVFAIGGSPQADDRDRIAGDPSETPAQVQALSEDDLITDDDTEHTDVTDWFTVDTFEGDGQAAFHPCAQQGLSGLGARAVQQRTFEMRNQMPDAPEITGDLLIETIAQFDSDEAARQAYDDVSTWVLRCEESTVEGYRVLGSPRTAEVPVGDATIVDAHWDYPEAEYEEAYISETGIVVVGDRIAVLTLHIVGQDYNFLPEDGGTPMERMLPKAAERLAPED